MKAKLFVTLLFVSIAAISSASAEVTMHEHKTKMESNIHDMDRLIVDMSKEGDAWVIRSKMKEHALLMNKGISFLEQMADAKKAENIDCIEREEFGEDSESCYEVESHSDIKYRLMTVLVKHVIERQNIILEKMGILNNVEKN